VSRLKVAEDQMDTVEARVGKMEAELRIWSAKLEALIAEADASGTGAKIDYRRRLEDMKTKYGIVQTRLADVRFVSSSRWETFQGGIEKAWRDLEAAFRRLAN
jgi:hypothetical protein